MASGRGVVWQEGAGGKEGQCLAVGGAQQPTNDQRPKPQSQLRDGPRVGHMGDGTIWF